MQALKEAREFDLRSGENSLDGFSHDDPILLNSVLTKGLLTSAEKGFSAISKSAIGASGRTGLGGVSGSQLHDMVKNVGKFFDYSFGPWEAIKIADKIGKGAKFLGPAMSVLGVGLQIVDDYQRAEKEKKILQVRRDIRKNFREYSKSTRDAFETQISSFIFTAFLSPVDAIDTSLEEIRGQAEKNSGLSSEMASLLTETKALRDEIQSAYE
nr:LeoA/HP0731 family dynamin-like GTPase [Halomonas alimentaria]